MGLELTTHELGYGGTLRFPVYVDTVFVVISIEHCGISQVLKRINSVNIKN